MDKKRLFVYIDEAQWFKRYLFLSELMPRVFFLVFMAQSPTRRSFASEGHAHFIIR